jgi:pimeloyl-ACP methyl ester carboxylesterase
MHALLLVLATLTADTSWQGQASAGGRTWPVAMRLTVNGTKAVGLVDFPAIHAYARPFEGEVADGKVTLRRVSPTGATMSISGELRGDTITGKWSGFGVDADLSLTRREPIPAHRESKVTFRNGDVTLGGTIVLPAARGGKYTAVVFTHGGGAQTRAFEISNAIYLARNGIASIVYDKRGTGESSGDFQTASMHDLANDALAAAALLRAHDEVARVGIYGYSQGGWIAPLAATLSKDLAFVIAGGLSAVNPMDQTIHHRANVMREAGFSAAEIERASALWRRLYDSSFGRANRAEVIAAIDAVRSEKWFEASALPRLTTDPTPASMLRFLEFDPKPAWSSLRVPVFAFWGADDIHVPVTLSRGLVSAALVEAAYPHFTLRLYPGIRHELTLRTAPGDFPRIETRVLEDVATWIGRMDREGMIPPNRP